MKNHIRILTIVFIFIGLEVNGQILDTITTIDSFGNPITLEFLENGQRRNYMLKYEYDSENRVTKEFVTDTLGEILPRIGLSEIITYAYKKEGDFLIKTETYLNKDLTPSVNDRYGFHRVKTKFNTQDQKIEEWFFSRSGKTSQRIGFDYNAKGQLSQVNYLTESGNLKESGVAIVQLEYDENGRTIKESNFDSKMNPFHSARIPFVKEIRYLDGIECKKFHDDKMVEFKTTKLSICETIPNIQLPNREGKLVQINEQNGKIKLIHFWASWSRPCHYSNEKLVELFEKLDTNQVEIISIALEKEGEQKKWKADINANNLNWEKHLSDFKHWQSKGALEFEVNSIPRFFILDENGFLIGNNLIAVWEIGEILEKKGKL